VVGGLTEFAYFNVTATSSYSVEADELGFGDIDRQPSLPPSGKPGISSMSRFTST
jgi:hypothetical protein